MAYGVLIYDLKDDDDENDFLRAGRSLELALVIWSYREQLWREIKETTDGTAAGLERACDLLEKQLDAYSIDIDALCP